MLFDRTRWQFVATALVLSSTAVAASEPPPRLVVIYAPCTVSAKYLDPYGGPGFTPNLAEFAKEAAVFTAHRTEANGSGPAFASIFSGQQADGHGVFSHPSEIAPHVDDLSEVLHAAGYEIFYWDTHRMADHDLGYVQAAGYATDRLPYPQTPEFLLALDKLSEDPSAKLAVFAAFSVTHSPYDPTVLESLKLKHPSHSLTRMDPSTFDRLYDLYLKNTLPLSTRYERTVATLGLTAEDEVNLAIMLDGLYSANIDRLDLLFRGLLDQIDQRRLRDDSLIIFTADHGESMNEAKSNTRWNHAGTLRTEVLTVPWLIAGSAVVPGSYEFVTRSIDVAPTVAGLIGLNGSPQWQGVNLAPVLRGEAAPPRLVAYSRRAGVAAGGDPADQKFHNAWAAVRDRNLIAKYRRLDGILGYRVYDVSSDPEEMNDILDFTNPRHVELVHALKCYRVKLWRAYREHYTRTAVPEDAEETLRSLGYIE